MRRSLILFYTVFFTGFFLKFFHIHFNAIVMLIGLSGILTVGIFELFKKGNKLFPTVQLAVWSWLLLLFVSVKFLPVQNYVLIMASMITVVSFILALRKQKPGKLLPVISSLVLALSFYFLPTDIRFKTLSINWNYEIETDYVSWDKYSWFLYQNGKYQEALSASEKAANIAANLNESEWVEFIGQHSNAIKERSWTQYR